jgi:hypothetical protein
MPDKKLGQHHIFANGCPHEAIEQFEKRRRQGLIASTGKHAEQQSQERIPVITPAAG